jgi:hypothetical protein
MKQWMFPAYLNVPPGTLISAPTHLFYRHYGIVTEHGTVLSCSARAGCGAEEPVDIFSGGKVWRAETRPSELPWWVVLHRARQLADRPYHLVNWNCETYVAACYGLPPRSRQVEITMLAASLGVLAVAALQVE